MSRSTTSGRCSWAAVNAESPSWTVHDAMALEREEAGHHLGRIHIVINNENAQRGTRWLDIARMRNGCKGRIVCRATEGGR